jgi:peroxiredoxin
METKQIGLKTVVLAVLISATTWVFGTPEASRDPNDAPTFVLTSQDNKEVKLSDFTDKGKIVVLEWVNPECPFVKAHYQADTMTMKKLAQKYTRDKKVVWLAINSTNFTAPQQNQEFVKQHELPYPILLDTTGKVGKQYKAATTPHLFIIDDKGKIVYRGAIDNAPLGKKPPKDAYVNYVEKALDELLARKAVSTPATKPYGCSVKYAEPAKAT